MDYYYVDLDGNVTKKTKKKGKKKATTTSKDKKEERTWFKKGQFEDGYQFGDGIKTIFASSKDLTENASAGIYGMGEKAVDAGAYIVGGVAGLLGADKLKDKTREFIQKDLYDERELAKRQNIFKKGTDTKTQVAISILEKILKPDTEEQSVLGEKTDSLAQSAGQLMGQVALQGVGVPWFITSGVTSFGEESENALNRGADYGEAGFSAAVSAGAELLTEKLFGGSALGEKGLINTDALTKGITNKALKSLTDFGVDILAEGSEEVASEFVSTLGQQLSYEKEDTWRELIGNEKAMDNYIAQVRDAMFGKEARAGYGEAFIGGAVLGGVSNAGKVSNSIKSGRDYRSDLTENEQKVVDKEVENRIKKREKNGEKIDKKAKAEIEEDVKEDLQKGFISIDTIESALGGETYDSIQKLSKEMEEYNSLNRMKTMEMTGEQTDRLAELKEKNKHVPYESEIARMKEQLAKEVSDATMQGTDIHLQESYNEKGRRSQEFAADVAQYKSESAQKTVQNAIGKMNNTTRAHEFVDRLAKISEDKGIVFDFTDSKKIAELGYSIEGKTVNGYIQGENVTLNLNSAQALNKVVGHEVTHFLEGTEHYDTLQQAMEEYVNLKGEGEYNKRLAELTERYKDVEDADAKKELLADLVGEYLFTDEKFVKHLSTKNRNVFQKIYDEIKYLAKTFKGTEEAKQLEKVKRIFEQVYKEDVNTSSNDRRYSVSEVIDLTEDNELAKRVEGLYGSEKYKQIQNYILDVLGEQPVKLRDGKEAIVDKSDALHMANKAATKKTAQIAKIKELVENAELYAEDKNVEHNKFDYFCYYKADVRFEEEVFPLYLNVGRGKNDAKYHVYDITNKIRDTADRINGLERPKPNEGYALTNDISKYSISENEQNTTENQKKSLSDNAIAPEPAGNWNIKGKDVALEELGPIAEEFAPAQRQEAQQVTANEWNPDVSDDLEIGPFSPANSNQGAQVPSAEEFKNSSVKESNRLKLENYQQELQRVKRLAHESYADFSDDIAEKQKIYDSKTNKNTKEAQKLLRTIERLKERRDDIQIDYGRRENKIQEKIDKMNSKEFRIAEQRQSKQEEYRELLGDLMGDTSTWQDKKMGISYQTNTLRRNLRDVVRDADGKRDIARADAIYEELQGKYNKHEAELNREANRIKKVYADMKINKAEDAYIQMLGEYRHNPDTTITPDVIQEYYEKHKDKIDTVKVDKAIESARKLYDSLFFRVNSVLKEQGMKEIGYREGYFPHFTEDKQHWLAKLFNWKSQNNDIPTDIAGLTEQFKPDRSWQSFNKHRTGDTTDYSFMKGLDTYVKGSLDWIYHIEDIQKRRAFENEIRYRHSEQGVKDKLDAIHKNEEYDADEMQAQIDTVLKEAKNPLNNFVTDLRKGTNVLAGKKDSGDRYIEEKTSRKIYSTMTNISNRVTANMVAGSISSALTNFIPITQSWGQVSPISSLKGMKDTLRSTFVDDGMIDKSDFLTNRLRQEENLYKDGWDKIGDKVGFLMEAIDSFTSQTVWRSKYIENTNQGMSEEVAIKDADQFAENVIAGRSRGNMPTIFNEKNLATKMLTAFQLEVANQYGYMFKDMPQDMQNDAKGKLVKGYATMFIGAYVYNALYSTLTGRDAAFDPIGIVEELLQDLGLFGDDEEEKEPIDAITNLATNVVEELPFVGGLVGGGRIPISSALPYDGFTVDSLTQMMSDLSEGDMKNFWQEMMNPVYYLAMPMGGGQLRKTIQGMSMFDDDLPIAGSYTDSGKLRYSVEDTPTNRVQAAVFGQYANENAREYFDEGRAPLNEKKTQELADLDIPISEYWDIQDKLQGKKKLAEKADVISNLDLPIAKKNILINNATTRKEPIDLTDYDLYADFEEFDFATKNPEKYLVAKMVGGYKKFRTYQEELNEIQGDKNRMGQTISGSRKRKVVAYINGLNASYMEKMLLFKSQYPSDNQYNGEIINYINKSGLNYSEKVALLKELGFTVTTDGKVR